VVVMRPSCSDVTEIRTCCPKVENDAPPGAFDSPPMKKRAAESLTGRVLHERVCSAVSAPGDGGPPLLVLQCFRAETKDPSRSRFGSAGRWFHESALAPLGGEPAPPTILTAMEKQSRDFSTYGDDVVGADT